MPTPTIFEGINPRGTETLIPCKDAKAQNGVIANTKLIKDTVGWSAKNEFNYKTCTNDNNASITLGTFTNTVTDTKDANLQIVLFKDGTSRGALFIPQTLTQVGHYEFRLNLTGVDFNYIRFGHNGNVKSFDTRFPFTKTGYYLFSFDATGVDPSTVGGYTLTNIMLRKETILDDSFEPYRNTTAFPRDEQRVLGAKNLLKYPYLNTSSGLGTITITDNKDGSLSMSAGTSSGTIANYVLHSRTVYDFQLPKGTYKFTGGISDKVYFAIAKNRVTGDASQGGVALASDYGNGVIFTLDETSDVQVIFTIEANTTVVAQTIKPMIRLASDPDDTYVPPTMTNRELTEKAMIVDFSNDVEVVTGLTAYEVSSFKATRCGNVVNLHGEIKSLTEDGYPAGRSIINVLTGIPRPYPDSDAVDVIIAGASENVKPAQINLSQGKLKMRGGTPDKPYLFNITYITNE